MGEVSPSVTSRRYFCLHRALLETDNRRIAVTGNRVSPVFDGAAAAGAGDTSHQNAGISTYTPPVSARTTRDGCRHSASFTPRHATPSALRPVFARRRRRHGTSRRVLTPVAASVGPGAARRDDVNTRSPTPHVHQFWGVQFSIITVQYSNCTVEYSTV